MRGLCQEDGSHTAPVLIRNRISYLAEPILAREKRSTDYLFIFI
jgi:hypothetical protein